VLHTGADLISVKQLARLDALFADDTHVEVQATWAIYQDLIAAYRAPDPATGRARMERLITTISGGVPTALAEVAKLGRTLKQRAGDILAFFDRPGSSNGPTEALNGEVDPESRTGGCLVRRLGGPSGRPVGPGGVRTVVG